MSEEILKFNKKIVDAGKIEHIYMTAPFTGLIQALQWKSDGFKLALCDPTHTNNHKETEIQKYKNFSYTCYKILNNKNVEI